MKVEIDVKEEWLSRAREYGKATGYKSMETGKTGEYAVISYLRGQGVQLREDQTPMDKPDHFDILARGSLIEVKSTRGREIRIPKATFDRGRRFWVYIGVRIDLKRMKAWIYGYIKKEEVPGHKVVSLHGKEFYSVKVNELKPVEELLPFLKEDA